MSRRKASGIFLLVFLGGCRLAPTAYDLEIVRQLPPPPGPFVRMTAVADLESRALSGTFEVLLLARSGPRPLVRLQLLPDLGGKALDLLASPEHLTGWFPATGEGVDWALPGDASSHPLLFIAITLLERFAPVTEDRLLSAINVSGVAAGVGPSYRFFELTPLVEGAVVLLAGALWEPGGAYEWRFQWGWARWSLFRDEIRAKDFRLKLRDTKIEPLGALDESLLRLELPAGVRRR